MYHPPCLVRVVVVTVCKVDWYTVWIPWFVMCHCPSECIGMRDLRKCDKESWFPEVCYRRSALARWLGDKIADLLEYFLGSYSKFSSTFYNKRLEVCVVQGLIRLKVFKNILFLPWFWQRGVVFSLPEHSTIPLLVLQCWSQLLHICRPFLPDEVTHQSAWDRPQAASWGFVWILLIWTVPVLSGCVPVSWGLGTSVSAPHVSHGWHCSSCKFSGVGHANPAVPHNSYQCFVQHSDSTCGCICAATFQTVA